MITEGELDLIGRPKSRIARWCDWIKGPGGAPAQLAHRLTHPRRKRKVIALEWQRAASYEELLASRWPSVLRLHGTERPSSNCELLFPELATPEVLESHFLAHPGTLPLGLGCLRDALVSGQSLVGRSWLLYRLAPFTPAYVDDYLSNNLHVGDRKITRKERISAPGVTVLVTHWNSNVYGHWLVEGMPKLLLLRQIAHHLPPLRIVLPTSLGAWVSAWIKEILPGAAIESYDDGRSYLHCRTLLVPTLLADPVHHLFHPELARLLATLEPPVRSHNGGRKLYVSRVASSLYRQLANQAEIEGIAVSEGLELVKPETLPICEQIALFASAELLVGEFGSAMHNALFSPRGTRVFCLNWINGVQSRIAQLKEQRVGYLLPSDGVPVKYVEGASRKSYHIDPHVFRECVRALLSA
jgi:capsular polysaccharide biosynthesis protein